MGGLVRTMLREGEPKKPAVSGHEGMLRALGLGQVLDAAKQLADANTVQKIMKFADDLERLNLGGRLDRIERALGISTDPDPGLLLIPGEEQPQSLEGYGTDQQPSGLGAPRQSVDGDPGRSSGDE